MITVNGQERATPSPPQTIAELLAELGLADAAVAVEVNREVVPRRLHASTAIEDGDVIELVTLVGGG